MRAVRRKGSHADRWDWEEFRSAKGLPWEPIPERPEIEIGVRIEDGMLWDMIQAQNEREEREPILRVFRI